MSGCERGKDCYEMTMSCYKKRRRNGGGGCGEVLRCDGDFYGIWKTSDVGDGTWRRSGGGETCRGNGGGGQTWRTIGGGYEKKRGNGDADEIRRRGRYVVAGQARGRPTVRPGPGRQGMGCERGKVAEMSGRRRGRGLMHGREWK